MATSSEFWSASLHTTYHRLHIFPGRPQGHFERTPRSWPLCIIAFENCPARRSHVWECLCRLSVAGVSLAARLVFEQVFDPQETSFSNEPSDALWLPVRVRCYFRDCS